MAACLTLTALRRAWTDGCDGAGDVAGDRAERDDDGADLAGGRDSIDNGVRTGNASINEAGVTVVVLCGVTR